ncbi:MAG TPA: DMT family transporter [Terriglobales bacterium]|nr:DMT family transporter [Terriglobales bacterium]
MPNTALISLLSLAAAVSWGAADFSGGLASKKSNVYGVVLVAHAVGLVFNLVVAFAWRDPWPGAVSMMWGVAAGLVGAVGLMSLYRALAIGTMGINAPVAAVVTGILPVAFTFVTLGLPTRLQLGGFSLALIAIGLIAMPSGELGRPKGLGLAVLAGVGFSGFLVCIKLAGTVAKFWPLVGARAASLAFMVILVGGMRVEWKSLGANWRAMVFCGIFDSLGNILFVYAASRGRLDIAAVLSSLYPASTLILARMILKERIGKVPALGIGLALASVAMIAA